MSQACPEPDAVSLVAKLADSNRKIVFAESCTCGLVSALVGQVPGVSRFLCGSAVTYRVATKQSWLSISTRTLEQHSAESLETTTEMARNVATHTPEADIAVAVTGHLGPDVDSELDGRIFIAVYMPESTMVHSITQQLEHSNRCERQLEAALKVIQFTVANI